VSESPYRASRPVDPYLVAWDDLRRRRRRRWISFWAWFPVVFYTTCIDARWIGFPWIVWVVGFVFLLHPHYFRCPGCGKVFEERGWRWLPLYRPFTRRCVWCAVEVGTPAPVHDGGDGRHPG
jgi:hypothetical protein